MCELALFYYNFLKKLEILSPPRKKIIEKKLFI